MSFQPRQPGSTSKQIVGELQSAFGYMRRQVWTHPAVGSNTAIHAALSSNSAAITTGITNPDFARTLVIVSAGSGHNAAGTVTITGTDIRGAALSETLTLNGNTAVEGTKAFKTVTNINMASVTGNDANNTVSVGTGTKLGLDRCMTADEIIQGSVDAVFESTRPVGTPSATTVSLNNVLFNTTLANTKVFRCVYIATEKTASVATTA